MQVLGVHIRVGADGSVHLSQTLTVVLQIGGSNPVEGLPSAASNWTISTLMVCSPSICSCWRDVVSICVSLHMKSVAQDN